MVRSKNGTRNSMNRKAAGPAATSIEGGLRDRWRLATKFFLVSLLVVLLLWGAADARGLKVDRRVKDYQVVAIIDRYPLVLGDNRITIEIRDGSGKNITDAEVLVNYYMPPMPRMVPMNYRAEARRKGAKYESQMDIIMAGPWYIKIIIKHAGRIATVKLNVDAQ